MTKKIIFPFILLLTGAITLYAVTNTGNEGENPSPRVSAPAAGDFNAYWYQGKAELSSYDLEQARYGEIHQGNAVLMFVTENFDPATHTKAGSASGKNVPVLKVNFDKKFITGVYPYSMLLTVATPVDRKKNPHSITVTASSQEWCGHTFTQLNLDGNSYNFTEHSYFPGEGDQEKKLSTVFLEDELWTLIRINPDLLPTGLIDIVPGAFFSRLKHVEMENQKATASLKTQGDLLEYSLEYQNGKRSLTVQFGKDFPHRIEGWQESYTSGWGAGAKKLTTKASRKNTIKLDYWNRNSNADRKYRDQLGL